MVPMNMGRQRAEVCPIADVSSIVVWVAAGTAPEHAQEMDVVQMKKLVCEKPSCSGAVDAVGAAAVADGGEEPWSQV
jgi:hypothetical protein